MNLIVAVEKQTWGIGCGEELLVRNPEDMAFFKSKTLGKVVVMGHSTLKSLPGSQPLKGRTNIVLSRQIGLKIPGALVCNSMQELGELLREYADEDIYVIGGQSIYDQLLAYCSVAYVTKFSAAHAQQADKFFPNLDAHPIWELAQSSPQKTCDEVEYNFCVYKNTGTQRLSQ